MPSPTNPSQKKSSIQVLQRVRDDETYILCLSEERKPKDRAIRESQEKDLREDLVKLEKRIAEGWLKDYGKIHEAIGRLKERYPRVARYYEIAYSEVTGLRWREEKARKEIAEKLDGSYALKTDRNDLSADEAWQGDDQGNREAAWPAQAVLGQVVDPRTRPFEPGGGGGSTRFDRTIRYAVYFTTSPSPDPVYFPPVTNLDHHYHQRIILDFIDYTVSSPADPVPVRARQFFAPRGRGSSTKAPRQARI